MERTIPRVPFVAAAVFACVALALSGGALAQPCPLAGGTPVTTPCEFLSFTNTPLNADLIRDASGNLVVCRLGGPVRFGVSWQDPARSGHEEWVGLGLSEWEVIDPPDQLTDGLRRGGLCDR